MDKVNIENLASASFESKLIYLSNRVYDDALGRVGAIDLFANGVNSNRKDLYEMEMAKVVLERTLEKVNKKLNAMYDAHAKEGK